MAVRSMGFILISKGFISIVLKINFFFEKCSGCGNCVDVCPMLISILDKEMKKIRLRKPETCINCKACINQCPTNALSLTPETEKAKRALEIYFEKNK